MTGIRRVSVVIIIDASGTMVEVGKTSEEAWEKLCGDSLSKYQWYVSNGFKEETLSIVYEI